MKHWCKIWFIRCEWWLAIDPCLQHYYLQVGLKKKLQRLSEIQEWKNTLLVLSLPPRETSWCRRIDEPLFESWFTELFFLQAIGEQSGAFFLCFYEKEPKAPRGVLVDIDTSAEGCKKQHLPTPADLCLRPLSTAAGTIWPLVTPVLCVAATDACRCHPKCVKVHHSYSFWALFCFQTSSHFWFVRGQRSVCIKLWSRLNMWIADPCFCPSWRPQRQLVDGALLEEVWGVFKI